MGNAALAEDTFGITEEEKNQKCQRLARRLNALFHRHDLSVELHGNGLIDARAINAGLATAENLVAVLENKKKWWGLKGTIERHLTNSGITPNLHIECDFEDDEKKVVWLGPDGIHCHKNECGVKAESNMVKMMSFGLGRSTYQHLDDNAADAKTKRSYLASYNRLSGSVQAEWPVESHWARNFGSAVSGYGLATTEDLTAEMDGEFDVGAQMIEIINKWHERH